MVIIKSSDWRCHLAPFFSYLEFLFVQNEAKKNNQYFNSHVKIISISTMTLQIFTRIEYSGVNYKIT